MIPCDICGLPHLLLGDEEEKDDEEVEAKSLPPLPLPPLLLLLCGTLLSMLSWRLALLNDHVGSLAKSSLEVLMREG